MSTEQSKPVVDAIYRHPTRGSEYRIVAVGTDATNDRNLAPMVVYEQISEAHEPDSPFQKGHIWVRDLEEFMAPGRFELVE